MKCSVIILNWNGEKMLRQFLPSVVQWTKQTEHNSLEDATIEIVVADNGSTDGSLQLLREGFSTVRIVAFDENYGFAEGYNKAIAQVDSEYIVLLNSDVEVTENWLAPILTYLDTHQDVVAVQPKILKWTKDKEYQSKDSSLQTNQVDVFEHAGAAGGLIDIFGYPYCRGRLMDSVEVDRGQYNTTMDVFWTSGACMVIRREAYLQVGGLDASFFAHQEEIDLCWRLNARGYRLVCLPQSFVYHLGGGSLAYTNPRKTFLNFRNNLLMLYKNLPAKILVWLFPIRFAMDYAAALVFLLKGETNNFVAVVKARCAFWQMRKQLQAQRKENLHKTITPHPQTIIHRSIVWDYYVRGMKS